MRANNSRSRILEAATQVLREGGPRPRLITSIAERAGVSRPTLYKYVGDRDAIYDALLRIELERVIGEVATRAERAESPRADFVEVVVWMTMEARNHPALQAVLAKHPEIMASNFARLLPTVLEIALPRLEPIMTEGAREGRWPEVDTRVAVSWTTRLITILMVMPMPEDSTEAGLRREVDALIDVATSLSAPRTS